MQKLYEKIGEKLEIQEVLTGYKNLISDQLLKAEKKIKDGEENKINGINQVRHLVSCIMILGNKYSKISSEYSEENIFASCLYYVLTNPIISEKFKQESKGEVLKNIRKTLDKENWFLNSESMKSLGIEKLLI